MSVRLCVCLYTCLYVSVYYMIYKNIEIKIARQDFVAPLLLYTFIDIHLNQCKLQVDRY